MPIFVKDYTWQQTEEYITIQVPLKNVHEKNVDLLTTKNYIKANYYPYIFEIFLLHTIDDTKSNCFIKDDEIIFELCKTDLRLWATLEDTSIPKSEKIELKKKYLAAIQNDTQEAIKQKLNKKSELKRFAVREQIAIDTKNREAIAKIKKEETEKALRDLHLLETNTKKQIEPPKKMLLPKKVFFPKNNTHQPSIPLPRKCQSVDISFTARQFPTPMRESRTQEEQEWLTKQAEARRAVGFVDEDLRPEERNPQWLKDKGDEFFKAKNYLAAISAYTTGIKISKNYVALYVNRSAAHFAIGNVRRTVEDCSTALELMTPICEANRMTRAKCIARRGAALCKMGLLKEGKGEIQTALKLVPRDEVLKQDLRNIESQMDDNSEIEIKSEIINEN